MLDLDTLAEKRAKSLNQSESVWRTTLWSPAFQKMSASMTDGEIEGFLVSCPSVVHVELVLRYINDHPDREVTSPYALLTREAHNAAKPATGKKPYQIGSCHIYKDDAPAVLERWPEFYTPFLC